tara:strand:- start:16492 stop:17043 length:552 start_codon:yes stop_codon:yes gene_type:complete
MDKIKDKIENTLLIILLNKDFNKINLEEIQKKSRISSKNFYKFYSTKEEIIISFFERVDKLLKKKIKKKKLGSNIKDNLFEICMTRLDLFNPYKKNLRNFYFSFKNKPDLFLKFYKSFFNSMKINLELSKININSSKKNLKVFLFSSFYLSIIYEWFKDDSINNEKIMSILDHRLGMIEKILI